jgi:hypothetical protein
VRFGAFATVENVRERRTGAPGGSPACPSLVSVLHDASLPESPERLFLYYHSLAGWFEGASAAAQVAFFARMALRSRTATSLGQLPEIDLDGLTRDLWQRLFDAELAQREWDDSYATLTAVPYPDVCVRIALLGGRTRVV